ncbi:hypothetical protein KY338_00250 [Candidatus Woesearchaeota archaeon]|nr:hypothetical protein [Candidatus Woesearchaeota archaeon]MBW3005247.1 hypothetical protein [Candidatus Woesearchaeota archaeon]
MSNNLRDRFKYPRHTDFFIVDKKKVTLKPRFKDVVKKNPQIRYTFSSHGMVHCYTERGTLLLLSDGPRYRYRRDEMCNCVAEVHEDQVVSADINDYNRWASNIWPVNQETFFKDINEIDGFISSLEEAHNLGRVVQSEFKRVLPIAKNQRIAHEILDEITKKYKIKKGKKVKVHTKKCAYGGPIPCREPLDHTVFCYIGQSLYRSNSPGPYMGQRIFHIEFAGTDLLYQLVKERFFPDKE